MRSFLVYVIAEDLRRWYTDYAIWNFSYEAPNQEASHLGGGIFSLWLPKIFRNGTMDVLRIGRVEIPT